MNSKIHQVTSFFGGALAVAVLCLLLAGCGFARAEKKGLEVFPDVQKFNQLFDKTNHKIDCHGGIGSHLSWGGKGKLYDHYLIYMGFDVSVDIWGTPRRVSGVEVWVNQYEYSYASGRKRRARSTLGVLSQEQWEKVKEPDDIFKFLNHIPIKNEPIEGVDEDLKFY